MDDEYGITPPSPAVNRHGTTTECHTCHGDRFVTVRLRAPQQTLWMKEHGIQPNPNEMHEEMAPCPDCNPTEISYWRHDRTKFTVMDPAQVREALQ